MGENELGGLKKITDGKNDFIGRCTAGCRDAIACFSWQLKCWIFSSGYNAIIHSHTRPSGDVAKNYDKQTCSMEGIALVRSMLPIR